MRNRKKGRGWGCGIHRKEIFHCFAISKFMKSTVLALEAVFESGFEHTATTHQKLTKTKGSPVYKGDFTFSDDGFGVLQSTFASLS